jgi:hypothetical protein
MIAREVMAYVWCQYLQHLLIVMILDMGEGLSREFLNEVAVDHRFCSPERGAMVRGLRVVGEGLPDCRHDNVAEEQHDAEKVDELERNIHVWSLPLSAA